MGTTAPRWDAPGGLPKALISSGDCQLWDGSCCIGAGLARREQKGRVNLTLLPSDWLPFCSCNDADRDAAGQPKCASQEDTVNKCIDGIRNARRQVDQSEDKRISIRRYNTASEISLVRKIAELWAAPSMT
jgi:hypothetical protein